MFIVPVIFVGKLPAMKTLFIYQTSTGYAISVAKEIETRLGGRVEFYNLQDKSLPDLSQFKRIIVGVDVSSEIHTPGVAQFCEQNRDQLLATDVGLYISCRETGDQARKVFIQSFPEDLQYHAKGILINGGVADFTEGFAIGPDNTHAVVPQPGILKDIDRFVRRMDRVFMPMMLFV